MTNQHKAPRGATISDDGQKVRCITARQFGSRNIGEPHWASFGEYERELSKGRHARFLVALDRVEGADDLDKIHGLTAFDVQQLHIRGIFYFGQLLNPGKDRLTDIALRSFYQVDRDLEGPRLKAIRGFREAASQDGVGVALEKMAEGHKPVTTKAKPVAKKARKPRGKTAKK